VRWGSLEYLIPGEQARISVRRHSASLVLPVARAVGLIAVLLALQLAVPADVTGVQGVLWGSAVAVLIHLGYHLRSWWVERLVVTTERMLLTQGVFTKTITMMPLGKVTDLTFVHTPMGRVMGYATMKVESAGQDQALSRLKYMPWGAALRDDLTHLVFGGR
jgi:membrane protein YdbS with pleckstrin-like domain